jgi:hypothetical protein
MAKSRSLEWNKARRTNVRDRISSPNRDSGSGGDIEVRPTPDGVKLFAKLGARWHNTFLSEGNTLNISKSVEEDTSSNTVSFSSNVNIAEKVGIGNTVPISILEIRDGLTTGGAILTLGTKEPTTVANDVLGRINFYAPLEESGTDAILVAASIVAVAEATFAADNNSTSLQFQTGASEVATTKMTIDEAGRVGIGIASPEAGTKLHVVSNEVLVDSVGILIVEHTQGAAGTTSPVMVQIENSVDADVHADGLNWIEFKDSGGIVGRITSYSDGVVNAITASDVRLKKNIRDTDINGLSIINSVRIRDFEWNEKRNKYLDGKTVQAQYVADELYEVYPLATSGTPGQMKDILDDDGNKTGEEIDPMGVGETRLVSVLIKAVQELSAKVTALEAKVS